jgi:hypothetical protein
LLWSSGSSSQHREHPPDRGLGQVAQGRIVEIDILADPERLRDVDLTFLEA